MKHGVKQPRGGEGGRGKGEGAGGGGDLQDKHAIVIWIIKLVILYKLLSKGSSWMNRVFFFLISPDSVEINTVCKVVS